MCIATQKLGEIDQLLQSLKLWKNIRITSWIQKFLGNSKCKENLSAPGKINEKEKTKSILDKT